MKDAMKRARENAGLTIKELSEKSLISTSTISNWERGLCEPCIVAAGMVCDVLHISLDEYIGRSQKED